jgi:cell division protein FtsN
VRDYNEKRGPRESIERKPVAKNRPRKESNAWTMLVWVLAPLCTFGAGVFTGWLIFKGPVRPAPVAQVQPAKTATTAPAVVAPKTDTPLTFYKTLPAGGKGTLGTGLNPKKPEPLPAPVVREVPQAPAPAPAAEAVEAPASAPAPAAPAASAAAAKTDSAVRYVVQVASYREKPEALAAQAKLTGKGIAAYLVESRLADKGVWYRLRVGRHLTKGEAGELAGKAGKGSLVLPE